MNDAPARSELFRLLLAVLLLACWTPPAAAGFRVAPYPQNPSPQAVSLVWLSQGPGRGRVLLARADGDPALVAESVPVRAGTLAFRPEEKTKDEPPFLHRVRLDGLVPGEVYRYRVEQDGEESAGSFRTPTDAPLPVRFVVFGDSETEPESLGKKAHWPGTDEAAQDRRYLVDQETGYRENLRIMQQRKPDFVAIAGDLVESGGEQRDWEAFWRLTGPLAANSFILPALGNHEYFAGPGQLGGYGTEVSEAAVQRYRSYFDLPDNQSGVADDRERYYRVDWGPVTLIVLDLNNGLPDQGPTDTNAWLLGAGEGGHAPDWQPGSTQYRWLEQALREAQGTSAFTFVMFHHCPYSSGVHGLAPGKGEGRDPLSGRPLQELTPLFMRYGVDAVFTGHDEMYEHSVIPGEEARPGGSARGYGMHVYDVGIGGDGLRGPIPGLANPYRVFLAHDDSPEVRDEQGRLIDGGKHYGHLEVNVAPLDGGRWEARLDMVYVFPVMGPGGDVVRFERRLYDDSTTLVSDSELSIKEPTP